MEWSKEEHQELSGTLFVGFKEMNCRDFQYRGKKIIQATGEKYCDGDFLRVVLFLYPRPEDG